MGFFILIGNCEFFGLYFSVAICEEVFPINQLPVSKAVFIFFLSLLHESIISSGVYLLLLDGPDEQHFVCAEGIGKLYGIRKVSKL
jgi:hypothetical protein